MGKRRDREARERHVGDRGGEPLVVDLPDGQKLYVGSLEDGMAIEVATWRGVGEPDSRVARMIIAANRDGTGKEKAQNPETPKADVIRTQTSPVSVPRAAALPNVLGGTVIRQTSGQTNRPTAARNSTVVSAGRRIAAALVAMPLVAVTGAILTGWLVLAKPIPSLASELNLGSSGVILAAGTPSYQIGDEVLARVSSTSNQAAVIAPILSVDQDSITIIADGTPVQLKESQILGRLITTLPIGAEVVDRPLLAAALVVALLIGAMVFAL